jgi:3' terminal RNA ribose 2'-O-methyltransferase Hen1
LLAKHPEKLQTFSLAYGRAHVFYPVATSTCCTAALLLEIDPVGLVRGRPLADVGSIGQYVNDRPYVASSFTSVAIAQVFGSALAGRSRERPELAETPIPLEVDLEAVPCRGGESFLRRLFEPLDYRLEATRLPLDPEFPEWGESNSFRHAPTRREVDGQQRALRNQSVRSGLAQYREYTIRCLRS